MTKITPAQAFRSLARYCDELAAALEGEGGPSVHRDTKPESKPKPSVTERRDPDPEPARPSSPAPLLEGSGPGDGELTAYERKLLTAMAQRGGALSALQVGIMAGVSHTSGSFVAALADLRRAGYVEGQSSELRITQTGIEALGTYPRLPGGDQLFQFWCDRMGKYCTKILQVLRVRHRQELGPVSAAEIGAAAEVSHTSGSFVEAIAKLRRAELVTGSSGALELSAELKEAVEIRISVFDRQAGKSVQVDRRGVARG